MSVFLYPPLSLSTISGPVAFVNDSVNTSVEMDSVTPANIKALPTELIFKKDGVNTRVSYDTVTPTNSEAVPVNIVSANGIGIETTVNLSGAQINVQLSDRGASPDAVRIGDGTNTVNVTPGFELKTNDADANISLGLIDANLSELRNAVTTEGGAQPSNVLVVGGHDGAGNSKHFLTDATGRLSVNVNNSALPTGGATSANQTTEITALGSLLTELQLKADLTETQPVSIAATVGVSGTVAVSNFPATQPVSATSLPLPTGASTEATLSTLNGKVPANLTVTSTRLLVDGSGVTQPVSASSLPLPIGAATEAKQDTQITSSNAIRDRLPPAIGENSISNSLSIVSALGAYFSVLPRPLTSSYDEKLTLTSVSSFTAPTNAIGGKIMAHDGNLANVRYKQGGVATVTSGMQLQAGRSEDFQGGDNISVISESGTNAVFVQWTIQA